MREVKDLHDFKNNKKKTKIKKKGKTYNIYTNMYYCTNYIILYS